jgi:hypothetical protein
MSMLMYYLIFYYIRAQPRSTIMNPFIHIYANLLLFDYLCFAYA